jgi:hypothetical protein
VSKRAEGASSGPLGRHATLGMGLEKSECLFQDSFSEVCGQCGSEDSVFYLSHGT